MSGRQQRVMVQPINVIFKYLQQRTFVTIWLYDNVDMRIEGQIIGFDEFMNVVLDQAAEVYLNDRKPRKEIGRILLKGDNITLVAPAAPTTSSAAQIVPTASAASFGAMSTS